jgi:hypothetical protein
MLEYARKENKPMSDVALSPIETPRRFPMDWIPGVLFTPRQTMAKIAAQSRAVWFFPLMILTLTAILNTVVAGPIKIREAQMKGPNLPPDYQYYSPEQQAQIMQAWEATQKPVFIYVFPGLIAVAKVWVVWLIIGGVLHLAVTMLGGRGSAATTLNIVAWASLPLAVRDAVRIIAMLSTGQMVASPGLSGFAPIGEARIYVFFTALLALIDIYVIWYTLLLVIGIRAATKISLGKALGAVMVTVLLSLTLGALLSYGSSLLSNLNVVRPFFF